MNDSTMKRCFANVPRHNGYEAWRKIMVPLNVDKALARDEHLPRVTNPRPAKDMDDLAQALEDWETSKRLYAEADGVAPGPDQERMAFVS